MKKLILIILFVFSCLPIDLSIADEWLEAKSSHFIVYYKDAKESFINRVIEKSEGYYDKIADDLGFRRYNFWLWDNRAKIYIYNDADDYQVSTGQPAWSSGSAIPKDKIIRTFPGANDFFDRILPHEMGHIIFREFVGFDNNAVPVWLDEGVASLEEGSKYSSANMLVKQAIRNEDFIGLKELAGLNPHLMPDDKSVNLFYAESASIAGFLIKEFGKDSFVLFCQNLRDKKDLERSISYVYPFRNIDELSRAWQEHLE